VPCDTDADIYVINTCSVTAISDKKSRQTIRKLSRAHKGAIIAVCGCMSQVDPDACSAIEGVDIISGTGDKHAFIEAIERAGAARLVDDAMVRREFEVLPAGGIIGHTRAMLKIQDGCRNFCSYCIIPYARGPVRSMPRDIVIAEARRLAECGYREIVLTGIEISSYGVDFTPRETICDLIYDVCTEVPTVRIRLGSLEPRTIDEIFIEKTRGLKNLCPQFHLSLQSGCDATLSRMRRKYDTERYLKSVKLLRESFENCAITTDLIVGFPGESENEFSQTLAFIKECAFSAMHIFPYSKRAGTPAAVMSGQITRALRDARAHAARAIADEMQHAYLASCVGETLNVLFEEECDGMWRGHAGNYAHVCVHSDSNLKNQVMPVRITDVRGDKLIGKYF
ncbi:MAG: tRNA (N(6)-L-threonylcarbamoyladenosine(37)-C(2))-methylthiotransferase MtaB, partial [Clostridia bacterium]